MKKQIVLGMLIALTLSSKAIVSVGHDDLQRLYIEQKFDAVIRLANQEIEKGKGSADTYYYKGLSEQSLYKMTDALNSFEMALTYDTTNTAILISLAGAAEMAGNTLKAMVIYKQLISSGNQTILAKSRLARIYKIQKEYMLAIEQFSDLVKLDTTNAYFYSELAYCCSKFGLNEPAIDYYIRALILNPSDFESSKELINELIDQKFYSEAQLYIDTFLIRFYSDLYFMKQKAYLLALEGQYLDAVREFKQVVEKGDSTQFTCKYYGQSLYNNGQFDEAIYWLDRYLQKSPEDSKNQFIMAMACQKGYQYQKSLDHFNLTFDQIYNPDLIAKLYFERANTLAAYGKYYGFRDATGKLANEKFQEATQQYIKALETKPDYNEVLLSMAQHYESNLKDPRLALYYYEQYYKRLDPQKAMPGEVEWLEKKMGRLKEEVHFIGD